MDAERERRIREAYAAFAHGDVEPALRDFSADPSFAAPDYALEAGERHGIEAVAEAFRSTHEWMQVESTEVEEIVEGPDGVLVMARVRGRGRASGVPVDERYAHVLHYRGEQVERFNWFESRDEGLAAIGLDPESEPGLGPGAS